WGVSDISDDGTVLVGNGRNPQGRVEGFVVVIPEPSTVALAAAAILLILLAACPEYFSRHKAILCRTKRTVR
ncbi:MAG TPA: hypothetical protein VJ809_00165, partial [Pirellulales bacterium]|nr:hypothetical protein [Pirellulales bacterium]